MSRTWKIRERGLQLHRERELFRKMHRCTGNCGIRGEINYYSDLNILIQRKRPLKFDSDKITHHNSIMLECDYNLSLIQYLTKFFQWQFNDEIVFVQKKKT